MEFLDYHFISRHPRPSLEHPSFPMNWTHWSHFLPFRYFILTRLQLWTKVYLWYRPLWKQSHRQYWCLAIFAWEQWTCRGHTHLRAICALKFVWCWFRDFLILNSFEKNVGSLWPPVFSNLNLPGTICSCPRSFFWGVLSLFLSASAQCGVFPRLHVPLPELQIFTSAALHISSDTHNLSRSVKL